MVDNGNDLDRYINGIMNDGVKVVGFDCEWKANKIKGECNLISLVQLCFDNVILLVRMMDIMKDRDVLPVKFIEFLNDVKIIKTGVGINNDKSKMLKDYNIMMFGLIELNDLYCKVYKDNIVYYSLKKLCKLVLNKEMKYKRKSITLSNWENKRLSSDQIHYACDDAMVSLKIFYKLIKELCSNNHGNSGDIIQMCYGLIDNTAFNSKNKIRPNKNNNNNKNNDSNNRDMDKKEDIKLKIKDKNERSYFCKNKIFDNIKILGPDNEMVSFCSKRTMNRYLKKGWAIKMDDNTMKLTYKPNDLPKKPKNNVTISLKKNECVVCGNKLKLVKFNIMLPIYRKLLSKMYNAEAYLKHDRVVLCIQCQTIYEKSRLKHITILCKQYNIMDIYHKHEHYKYNPSNIDKNAVKMYGKCYALRYKYSHNMPYQVKIDLLKKVCDYFKLEYTILDNNNNIGKDKELYSDIIKVSKGNVILAQKMDQLIKTLKDHRSNTKGKQRWINHAKEMVNAFKKNEFEFIKLWRQHFIDTMKPEYMPPYFNINTTFKVPIKALA